MALIRESSVLIEVVIKHVQSNMELGRIRIESTSPPESELADYSIRFAVERGSGVGIHQRGIYDFPRTKFNVFALLRQALGTLEESELELTHEAHTSNMAGRLRAFISKIQDGKS